MLCSMTWQGWEKTECKIFSRCPAILQRWLKQISWNIECYRSIWCNSDKGESEHFVNVIFCNSNSVISYFGFQILKIKDCEPKNSFRIWPPLLLILVLVTEHVVPKNPVHKHDDKHEGSDVEEWCSESRKKWWYDDLVSVGKQ